MIRYALSLPKAAQLALSQSLLIKTFSITKQSSDIIQLTSNVMKMIMKPPIISQLKRKSLKDRIIETVNKSEKSDKVKQKIILPFQTGIQRNRNVYNQLRFQQAQKQQRIVFNPFHLVGSQIFEQMNTIASRDISVILSYGHFGTSKSFQYYQHQYFTTTIIKQLIDLDDKERANEIEKLKQNGIYIMKIIYWNIPENIRSQHVTDKYLIQMFKSQCTEISSSYFQKYQDNFQIFVKRMSRYYKEKGIKTCLVIDQINALFSIFRKKLVKQQLRHNPTYLKNKIQRPKIDKKVYKNYRLLNKKRLLIQEYFNKTVFNSSVNIQARYPYARTHFVGPITPSQLEQKLHKDLLDMTKLKGCWLHEKYVYQVQLKYPQLLRIQFLAWELTDFVIFELGKKILQKSIWEQKVKESKDDSKNIKNFKEFLREIICKKMKEMLNQTTVIPFLIRSCFQNFMQKKFKDIFTSEFLVLQKFLDQIYQILNSVQKKSQQLQKNSLQSYLSKIPSIKQKHLIIKKINDHANKIMKKKQENLSLQLVFPHKKQISCQRNSKQMVKDQVQRFLKEVLYFFEDDQSQLSMSDIQKKYFDKLDRNLFMSFQEHQNLMKYIRSLLPIVFNYLIVNQKDEKIRSIIQQLKQQKYLQYRKKFQNKIFPLVFIFVPCQKIVNYLEENIIYQIKNKKQQFIQSYFQDNDKSSIGQFIQKCFKKAFSCSTLQVKVEQIDYQFQKIQNFHSFPKKQQNLKKTLDGPIMFKKRAQIFFNQFLNNMEKKTILFLPVNKFSIAMDFVIRQNDDSTNTTQISYYEISVSETKRDIINKINDFEECLKYFDKVNHKKVKNNFYIITTPINCQQFKNIEVSYKKFSNLLEMSKEDFINTEDVEFFLKQLYLQYRKKKKITDEKDINHEISIQIMLKLFQRSLRQQQITAYSRINQLFNYQLKNYELDSFQQINFEKFKSYQKQDMNFLFDQLKKQNEGIRINNLKFINLCHIQFSKENKQYVNISAIKQIYQEIYKKWKIL